MRRPLLVLLALGAALVVPAGAAAAIHIRSIDTSAYPRVRVTVVTASPTGKPPALRENGKAVPVVAALNFANAKSIVLSVDRSQSMTGRPLAEAVDAAKRFVDVKSAGDEVAVAPFASGRPTLTAFSSSRIDAVGALRSIRVDSQPGTRLYDDLVLSARGLAARALPGKVIVVVTDGNETSSHATFWDALKEARKDHVLIFVVAIQSKLFTPGPLKKLAAGTGGKYYAAASVASLSQIYANIAEELKRTWRVEYLTASRPGEKVAVQASVGRQGIAAGTVLLSAAQTSTSKSALPKSAFSTSGTILLALIVGLLFVTAISLVFRKSGSEELRRRIQPHIEVEPVKKKEKRDRTSVLKSLFRATESVLGRTRQWSALSRLLVRGNIPLKTVEFAYVMLGSGVVVAFIASLVASNGVVLLIGFALGLVLPVGFAWREANKRVTAFDAQLPDLLMSVAASLKAGHSFKQAIQTVVEDAEDPARQEFQRVLAETSLGRSMEEGLTDMADRLGSSNFSFIVTAVSIQNQVGGSLAGLFDMVADTVRQRQMFARKIRALTAMGRASAYVLVALPFFLALILTAMNHSYMSPLYTTSTGHELIIAALVMIAIGSLILRKIVGFKG
jgi:tight adherence protein B